MIKFCSRKLRLLSGAERCVKLKGERVIEQTNTAELAEGVLTHFGSYAIIYFVIWYANSLSKRWLNQRLNNSILGPWHLFNMGMTMSCRVLIVDDNKDAADMLDLLLQTFGYTTAVAYHGQAALDQLDVFHPRVILLDMSISVLSGYETASAIRARPDGQTFHIIALSAHDDPTSIARMVEVGCAARLTKPASIKKLLAFFP